MIGRGANLQVACLAGEYLQAPPSLWLMTRFLPVAGFFFWAACSSNPVVEPEEAVYVSPPIPVYGATPSSQQLAWQNIEVTAFIHYGVNTFTGREWGTGDESPSVFNPTDLDAGQWAAAARSGGIGGIILTAKHHDGFALWPSEHTDHSLKASPWRGGQGDLVREVEKAVRAEGLEFGIYLSPWDRHEPSWGTAAYNDFYVRQLREVTDPGSSGYGPLFEVWLDGAHGEEVTQEQLDTYDGARWEREIRSNQPSSLIAFSRDVQYSGNEEGRGERTYWNDKGGYWSPAECNMPFRTGWFWHESDNPKSTEELVDAYFRTVGRDCVLLLGLAPDTRGLLEAEDVDRLREWKAALDRLFEVDHAEHTLTSASSVRPGSEGWSAGAATDGSPSSFWASGDASGWIEVALEAPRSIGVVEVGEPVSYGQRIASFHIEAWADGKWREVGRGTTVGRRRLLRIEPVTATRWRLVIDEARAAPAVSQFRLFSPLVERQGS